MASSITRSNGSQRLWREEKVGWAMGERERGSAKRYVYFLEVFRVLLHLHHNLGTRFSHLVNFFQGFCFKFIKLPFEQVY